MMQIVSTPAQAIQNIRRFEQEVAKSPELQARLPYARAWYAIRDAKGAWRFGPSKFVGFVGLDAETYLQTAQENDGRRTEAQLQSFFKTVEPQDPLYEELSSALVTFLAKYGKAPSTKMRINIDRGIRRLLIQPVPPSTERSADHLVRVIVAAAATLPSDQLKELRDQIEEMWSS